MKNNCGFTLNELLIVIGILIILAVPVVSSFRFFQRREDLNNSTEEIINALRLAQNRTLSSEGSSQYGVYFDNIVFPNQHLLFKGIDYSSRDTSFDEVYKLPATIELYDVNLGGGNEVVFDRITGMTSQTGSLSLRLKTDATRTQTIYIEGSGRVSLDVPAIPTDGRIEDSRHIHFDLGWSIQNATTLKFYFPDVPQTETVDTTDYFNGAKTEFDWTGTFSAGGTDQTLRVHTHSLDAFNTLLCIHRDRNEGRNDQEVIIYIVDGGADKDIAHYLADTTDTVVKGFYVNTMEVQ